MSTSPTQKEQNLVRGRKAARFAFAILIFGGASLILYGIFVQYLPNLLDGAVLLASASLPFVVWKKIEKKLNQPGV